MGNVGYSSWSDEVKEKRNKKMRQAQLGHPFYGNQFMGGNY